MALARPHPADAQRFMKPGPMLSMVQEKIPILWQQYAARDEDGMSKLVADIFNALQSYQGRLRNITERWLPEGERGHFDTWAELYAADRTTEPFHRLLTEIKHRRFGLRSPPPVDWPKVEQDLKQATKLAKLDPAQVNVRSLGALAATSKSGVGAFPLSPDTMGMVMEKLSGVPAGRSSAAHLSAAKAKAGIVGGPGGQTGPGGRRRGKTRKGKGKKKLTRRR